jgi:hypothetical protein
MFLFISRIVLLACYLHSFLFSQVLAAFLEEWCQWQNGKNTISIGCYQNQNYDVIEISQFFGTEQRQM